MRPSHLTVRNRRGQHGITLVELMVAMVLGLFLAGVVSWTYLQTASGTRFGALESQMNEEGALALELLRSQLRLAGYSNLDADGKRIHKELPLRGCEGGFTSATETGAFGTLACNGGTGKDAIALRYQATALNAQMVGTSPSPKPANCASEGIDDTTIAAGVTAAIADNRYYIAADATNDGTPTLFCRGSNGPGSFSNTVALVPNIEALQLRYALTRTPTVDEVPPHQVTAVVPADDPAAADWTRVAAVELCLIVRSAQPVPRDGLGMNEVTRYRDCDRNEQTATDGRLRRAYRALVALPNVRPALPKPFDAPAGVVANPYADLGSGQP